jgi:predicted nucleic acid-binding protein
MKYLILDTNILIDMLVYREKGNKSESYSLLIKLIDYGKVKLIVPPIIQTEILSHIDNEINKIGTNIQNIKRSIENIYWINHADKLKEFNTIFHPVKTGISSLNEKFKCEKDSYIIESHEIVNRIFEHKNTIIIDEPSEIINNVLRRKLHKNKPFDKKEDAFADAIIIESVTNIDKLIDFSPEDSLFLITRNYIDFSSENNKDDLHEDIQSNLDDKGLHNIFYRRLFAKTLKEDFQEEVQEAEIINELELEQSKEEEFYVIEYYADKVKSDRELANFKLESVSIGIIGDLLL